MAAGGLRYQVHHSSTGHYGALTVTLSDFSEELFSKTFRLQDEAEVYPHLRRGISAEIKGVMSVINLRCHTCF